MKINEIYQGNSLEVLKSFPDNFVDCCVSSPPYFALRDYGMDEQIGLEETPEAFIEKLVAVFHEIKRILKPSGTLWVNMGDSYSGSGMGSANYPDSSSDKQNTNIGSGSVKGRGGSTYGLKPKDLIGIPWMLAFALRADGWYLRSDIIWNKPNPMPESVTDRPTKAHEYIFLLSKSKNYYYDAEAIKELANYDGRKDIIMKGSAKYQNGYAPTNTSTQGLAKKGHERWKMNEAGERVRNKRSVWTVSPKPLADSHFATFPEKLIEDCIKAGSSEHGCCSKCGNPWTRITERAEAIKHETENQTVGSGRGAKGDQSKHAPHRIVETKGWQPTCDCNASIVKAVVIDPFSGAGTTNIVAEKLGRDHLGVELNPDYIKIYKKRHFKAFGLFA